MLSIAIAMMMSADVPAQDGQVQNQRIAVRRGTIEHSDHLSQMLKVRFEGNGGTRYFYVHQYVRVTLDGKPSALVFLKEKMAVDLHVLDLENAQLVIRVDSYYRTNAPVLERVPSGPFDDTAKTIKFYPRPNPAMTFKVDESLRMAVPKQYLVPLARSEKEMSATWDKFGKAVSDPAFSISEPWPIAVVPLGTKGKVLRVTDAAYEVEVTGGRYDHWHLFMKKEWAYPVDDTQAAQKAEEMAEAKKLLREDKP
jgi:hypothetical protein